METRMDYMKLSIVPSVLGQPFPDRLGFDLKTSETYQIGNQKRFVFYRVGQVKRQFDVFQSIFALTSGELGAGTESQALAGGFDLCEMRYQNSPRIIQIV